MATILANLERFMQATQPPRFGRPSTPAAPVAPTPRPATPAMPSGTADDATMQRYKALTAQGDSLRSSRERASFTLEQADKVIAECQQQAMELFQVNSLDELEAEIARQQAQDEAALNDYQAALQEEQRLQQAAQDKLRVLDQPV